MKVESVNFEPSGGVEESVNVESSWFIVKCLNEASRNVVEDVIFYGIWVM